MKKFLLNSSRRTILWFLIIAVVVGVYCKVVPAFAASPTDPLQCDATCINNGGTAVKNIDQINSTKNQSQTTTQSNSTPTPAPQPTNDKPWESDPERDNAGFVTKMIGDLVAGMAYALDKAGFTPIDQLVFGADKALPTLEVFATTDKGVSEFASVSKLYYQIFALAWVCLVVVVLFMGLRIAKGNSNPRARASIGELMMNLGVGIFLMCFSWFIVYYATEWNITLCRYIAPDHTTFSVGGTGDYLTSQVINLILVGMSIFINVMYVLRKFLLIGSVVIGPFVGIAYAAGNKQALSIWLSETITNAFMPLSHALVFALYFDLYDWGQKNGVGLMSTWYVPMVVIFFIIPVSAYFRRLFASYVGSKMGVHSESVAGSAIGAVSGLAGAAALAGSLIGGKASGAAKSVFQGGKGNLSKQAGSSMATSANAGALQRASSPSAIQTGIGQVTQDQAGGNVAQAGGETGGKGNSQLPTGIGSVQSGAGKGGAIAGKVGRTVGSSLGGVAGAAVDVGLAMATGGRRVSNFQKGLSGVGGAIGSVAARPIGGVVGGVSGAVQATKQARQNSKDGRRMMSYKDSHQQVMGLKQPSAGMSRHERGMNERAARRAYVGSMVGSVTGSERVSRWAGNVASMGTRKSLERLGSLKER